MYIKKWNSLKLCVFMSYTQDLVVMNKLHLNDFWIVLLTNSSEFQLIIRPYDDVIFTSSGNQVIFFRKSRECNFSSKDSIRSCSQFSVKFVFSLNVDARIPGTADDDMIFFIKNNIRNLVSVANKSFTDCSINSGVKF